MLENEYVFIIEPETGLRITSFLIGIHADTVEACLEKAKSDYPGKIYFSGGEEIQQQFYKDKRYIDGQLVDPPAPTPEEVEEARIAALNAERAGYEAELHNQLKIAELQGNTEAMESIKAEYTAMNEAYVAALKGDE